MMRSSLNHNDKMREDFKKSKGSVVSWLLMASYLYYHRFGYDPILTDDVFDKACKWLHDNYDTVDHRFKHIISKEDLLAGSLYAVKREDYHWFLIKESERLSRELNRGGYV